MGLKRSVVALLGVLCAYCSFAQGRSELTQSRVLILLDRSSSMINLWAAGREKYKVADELILKLMDSVYAVNRDVEFSLRVFGHRFPVTDNNCHDTYNEVPFGKDNRLQMQYRLEDIKPLGVTSIAYSLKEAAAKDIVDEAHNAYSILLITDGGESCGGDICEVMRTLIKNKVYFKPYIISLEDYPQLRSTYSCMGDYLQVTQPGDIERAVGVIVDAFRPIIKITNNEYKELQAIAAKAPSVLKVNVPTPEPKKEEPKPVEPTPPPAVKKPDALTIAMLIPARAKQLRTSIITTFAAPVKPPKYTPVTIEEAFIRPPDDNITGVSTAKTGTVKVDKTQAPKPKTVETPKFEPKIVEEEFVKPAPVAAGALTPSRLYKMDIDAPKAKKPKSVPVPEYEPKTIEEDFVKPSTDKIALASPSRPRTMSIDAPQPKKPKQVTNIPALPPIVADEPPPPPRTTDKIAALTPVKLRQFNIIFIIEDRTFAPHAVPPRPEPKLDIPAAPIAKAQPAPTPKGGTEYKVDVEDAKETTVEVYFTNGRGKYYSTTPQVLLLDPVKGNLLKRFYRTVDGSGNPDPQTDIAVGTYDLTFADTKSMMVKGVKVEKNKKNKIVVTVPNASLSFTYADAPNRPIKEFQAVVIERNKAQGKVVNQKCTEKLEYEPGNYHIIINTFPQDVRNVDLDFNETVITVPQPGFARFTADPEMSSVTLYQRLGDKFLSFHTLRLDDPSIKHLQIQPGEYQAHYHKGPGGPHSSEKVVNFVVRATKETEVILN